MSKNFYSCTDTPAVTPSPVGKDVYTWKYLDSTGKVKEQSKNLYEEIQSYKNQVDYKTKIERGEDINNGNGIYLDTTKFSGDFGDINEYLAGLADSIQSQINRNKNNKADSGAVGSEAPSETPTTVGESPTITSESPTTGTKGDNE